MDWFRSCSWPSRLACTTCSQPSRPGAPCQGEQPLSPSTEAAGGVAFMRRPYLTVYDSHVRCSQCRRNDVSDMSCPLVVTEVGSSGCQGSPDSPARCPGGVNSRHAAVPYPHRPKVPAENRSRYEREVDPHNELDTDTRRKRALSAWRRDVALAALRDARTGGGDAA